MNSRPRVSTIIIFFNEERFILHRGWRAMGNADPTPRHRLYRSLYRLLQPLSESERLEVLDQLAAWAGAAAAPRPAYRSLAEEEVVALAQGGLVEIGAHTVSHPVLPALPSASQWKELTESKQCLESLLDRPVTDLSFPYGSYGSWVTPTIDMVREAGFTAACTTVQAAVDRHSDPLRLPRFLVDDWDGEEFAGRLSSWFQKPGPWPCVVMAAKLGEDQGRMKEGRGWKTR